MQSHKVHLILSMGLQGGCMHTIVLTRVMMLCKAPWGNAC